jgi:hypothetical protein
MDSVHNLLPPLDLLIGVDAGCSEPATCRSGNGGGFRDDETAIGSALSIVLAHEISRDISGLFGA